MTPLVFEPHPGFGVSDVLNIDAGEAYEDPSFLQDHQFFPTSAVAAAAADQGQCDGLLGGSYPITWSGAEPGALGYSSRAAGRGNAHGRGNKSSTKPARIGTSLAQREAHKRYRERKKQSIAAMEAAVELKRSELRELQAENEQLKSRARVLQTAERCSVEIHELMLLLDGLEGLNKDPLEEAGVEQGCTPGSSGSSSLPGSSGSPAHNSAPTAAVGGAAGGSDQGDSGSSGSQQGHYAAADAAGDAAGAGMSVKSQPCSAGNRYLQTLMHAGQHSSQHKQQLQQLQALGAAGSGPHAGSQGQQQQQQQGVKLSLQDEAHWLQMAQQYLQLSQQDAAAGTVAPAAAAAAGTAGGGSSTRAADTAQPPPAAAAVAPGGEGVGTAAPATAAAAAGANSSNSSSVLAELGSVDTPEQGLVVYKAFLRKASELLALVQHLQQQGQQDAATATEHEIGDLTRSTIGRLQPFLVARGQGVVYDWNCRNLETQQRAEPPASMWPAVLDAMQLAADTQRDALHCFEIFGAPLTRLLEERAQLARQYRQAQVSQVASASDKDAVVNVGAARTLEAIADPMIASAALLRALAANLERYQSLDGVFAHSLTNLLTGAQIAAACVASWPFLPRWHTMMSELTHRKKEEEQQAGQQGSQAGGPQPQRRSSRVRVATQAAKESYA